MYKRMMSFLLSLSVLLSFSGISISSTSAITVDTQFYLGDVTLDGAVNVKDCTHLQKHLVGDVQFDETLMYIANVDGDLSVTIKDATYIQMYVADYLDEDSIAVNSDGYSIGQSIDINEENTEPSSEATQDTTSGNQTDITIENIPNFGDSPYVEINNNVPYFTSSEVVTYSFESYSELDELGRCGVAYACVGQDIMPTDERGSISSVTPTGWHSVQYDIVSGKYLYNRSHLIGWQLTGENANEKNLITGTRYLNVTGMLPFEDKVAEYVTSTDNHVLYRVTPIFEGNNLVANGVLMEAYSVEDSGDGICFNIYCYNVQPGIGIDYATGDSWLEGTEATEATTSAEDVATSSGALGVGTYILNTNSKKIHSSTCGVGANTSTANKCIHTGSVDALIAEGYTTCQSCMAAISTYAVNTSTKKIHLETCRYATSSNVVTYMGLLEYLTDGGYLKCNTCMAEETTEETTVATEPSTEATETTTPTEVATSSGALGVGTYILNTSTKKIHSESCATGANTSDKNKCIHTGSVDALVAEGYTTCQSCMTEIATYWVNTSTKKIHLETCRYATSSNVVIYMGLLKYLTEGGYLKCNTCMAEETTEETTVATEPSTEATETTTPTEVATSSGAVGVGTYILNTSTKKIHSESCATGANTSDKNKCIHTGSVDALVAEGYTTCQSCMTEISTYWVNTSTKKIHLETCQYATSSNVVTYMGLLEYLTEGGYSKCNTCMPEETTEETTVATEPSTEATETTTPTEVATSSGALGVGTYILNTSTKKIHSESCATGANTSDKNKCIHTGSVDALVAEGYTTCQSCMTEISIYWVNTSTKKIHLETCQYATSSNVVTYMGLIEYLTDGGYLKCNTCMPEETTEETTVATEPSTEATETTTPTEVATSSGAVGVGTYILNTSTKKIHSESCATGANTSDKNKCVHTGSVDALVAEGYTTCQSCMTAIATYAVNTSTKKIHLETCQYATSSNVVTYMGLIEYLTENGYILCLTCNPT